MKNTAYTLKKSTLRNKLKSTPVTLAVAFVLVFAFSNFSLPGGINAGNSATEKQCGWAPKCDVNPHGSGAYYNIGSNITDSDVINIKSSTGKNDNGDGDKKEKRREKKDKKAKSRLDGKYLARYECIDDFQFDLFELENPTNSFGTSFSSKKNNNSTGQTTRKINAKYLLEHASIESFLADEYETK